MSMTLPCSVASQTFCFRFERVFRFAEIASMQSWLIGVALSNGLMPLVQVAKLAPKPPNAGLLLPLASELKPLPQFGELITARKRSSEATPVVSEAVSDSPVEVYTSHVQSVPGMLPSKPACSW